MLSMNKASIVFVVIAVGLLFYISLQKNMAIVSETNKITVTPVEHASAIIRFGDRILYTDPVGEVSRFDGLPAPNIILLTDIHSDHLDIALLEALSGQDMRFIMPVAVASELPENISGARVILANGETYEIDEMIIEAVPMYNLPDTENSDFHIKGRGNGYVITYKEKRLYIAGDSAGTPEMRALENIDVALLPMNLPYTMSVEEAADAVLNFAPKKVYPYHYRSPDGLSDVAKFKELVNAGNPDIEVVLLNWYPEI